MLPHGTDFGHEVEEWIMALLPVIDIPHKSQANGGCEYFWWASRKEDRRLGIDCWITFRKYGEVAVDFTVVSDGEMIQEKIQKALSRGVVPVVLEIGTVRRAHEGNPRALNEFRAEIVGQVAIRIEKLGSNRMTRQRATRLLNRR